MMLRLDGKKRRTQLLRFVFQPVLVLTSVSAFAAFDHSPGNPEDGVKSWAANCSRCHNMRNPTDLRDDQWVTSVFHMRIRAGLTGEETRNILAYLQESNSKIATSKQEIVARPGRLSGEEIYRETCAACHGMDGKGVLAGIPDFTAASGPLAKPDNRLLTEIIKGINSSESNLQMPPHGGNHQLTDKDMDVVLKYIRKQFDPGLRNDN